MINSNFIMNLTMHVFLEDFQDIIVSPSMKIYPLIDFESLTLNI
jgi:hypothetical protein